MLSRPSSHGIYGAVAVACVSTAACSFLVNLDELQPVAAACPIADCAPVAPAGWTGPVLVYDGPSTATPLCPPSSPTTVLTAHRGIVAPPAQCSCTCGAAQPACDQAYVGYNGGTNCASSDACGPAVTLGSGCHSFPAACAGSETGFGISESIDAGACAPTPTVAVTPPTWDTTVLACSTQQTCSNQGKCLPTPSPFQTKQCVFIAADTACPAGPYSFKLPPAFTGVDDARSCTGCTCGPPKGYKCDYTLGVYSDAKCLTKLYNAIEGCTASLAGAGSLKIDSTTVQTGTCAPSAVTPTGAAAPSAPLTICCL